MRTQEGIWNKVLSVALIAAILGAIIALGYSVVSPTSDDEFTDFYILGLGGVAAEYPTDLVVGQESKLILGIVNHENTESSYQAKITINGITLSQLGPIHLEDEEKWENELSFSPQMAGANQKVEFFIYKNQATEPYLEPLHLWVNITETDGTLPPPPPYQDGVIIDHNVITALAPSGNIDPNRIPEYWIKKAKSDIHIAYEHTSHGTQLVSGMESLDEFMGGEGLYAFSMDQKYEFEEGGFFWDEAMAEYGTGTLVLSDEGTWYPATVAFLEDPDNYDVDVVMWSWCNIKGTSIPDYISNMEDLIAKYGPGGSANRATKHPVTFIFMTGHVNGDGGESGPTYEQNRAIREHCATNNRWLYDFADIEKYDLDGNYFGDRNPHDTCNYDGGNWAIEYQNSHTEGIDWYECESAHSQPVNANQKAFAAWWLLARLAGWDGEIVE